MKRQYNKPTMVVVDIEVHGMLCTSTVGMSSESQGNSSALSRRRGSSFDDDFEDW